MVAEGKGVAYDSSNSFSTSLMARYVSHIAQRNYSQRSSSLVQHHSANKTINKQNKTAGQHSKIFKKLIRLVPKIKTYPDIEFGLEDG
jgi:hypothetical protein